MKGKRCLITGGAGSIGSELVRQLAPKNKVFILDINETGTFLLREELRRRGYWVHSRTGDVRNKDTLSDVFADFKPEVVIHAAALKHVTPNQEYPVEAVQTNIMGTLNVVTEAKRWECLERFVFISTDKVVGATSVMGVTKLAAEVIVRLSGPQFVAVRFGNVNRSRGSVLEIWENQFRAGVPLTLTHPDMERYEMEISEACLLVTNAMESTNSGLMVMDMGKRMKISDLLHAFLVSKGKPNYSVDLIGVRPGEELSERLMTEEEEKRAVRKGKFWIIQ